MAVIGRTRLTVARLVNWPEALLEATGGSPFAVGDLSVIRQVLHARATRRDKVFTGAYVIPGVPGRNKVDSILDLVELVSKRSSEILHSTMRETWAALVEFDGLGSFLAGQIVADLARLSAGGRWADRDTLDTMVLALRKARSCKSVRETCAQCLHWISRMDVLAFRGRSKTFMRS